MLSRPKMYTSDGSYAQILAYLNGYQHAAMAGTDDQESVEQFFNWLFSRIECSRGESNPETVYNHVIGAFGTDTIALDESRATLFARIKMSEVTIAPDNKMIDPKSLCCGPWF